MTQRLETNIRNQPWWNRPIIGNQSAWEQLKAALSKPEVPREREIEHQQSMREAQKIANLAYRFDSEIFDKPEFTLLIQTKSNLEREVPGYEGLKFSAELLETALEARECFRIIEQIELQYYGKIQQQFYQKVFQLLSKDLHQPVLQQMLKRLSQSAISKIKTKEGKRAIQNYTKQIEALMTQHELGIHLFINFKNNHFQDFSILEQIVRLVKKFQTHEVHNSEEFLIEVDLNNDVFQQLGDILKLPDHARFPKKYAILLQYLVLKDKYKNSDLKLNELLNQLKQWYRSYQKITRIRKNYPKQFYKQPSDFKQPIPGFDLYQKYQKWLLQLLLTNSHQ